MPAMPCSGEKIAWSRTPGAPAIRSIARRPRASIPVWFVTRPTAWPRNGAKPRSTSTSRPDLTVSVAGDRVVAPLLSLPSTGSGTSAAGPLLAAVVTGTGRNSAAPAAAVTRVLSSRMRAAPPPLGCTRLVRRMRYVRLAGSIQIDVPVNPVCPTDPPGKKGAMISA